MAGLLRAARRHRRGVEEQHDRAVGEQRWSRLRSAPVWSGSSNSATRSPRFMGVRLRLADFRSSRTGWEDYHVQTTVNLSGGSSRERSSLAVTTSREDFRALAAGHRVVPVTRKVLADSETPLSAYRKLAANRPGTFLLESAENGRSWSRWSFIGAGAPSAFTVRDGHAAWLGVTPQDAPSGGDPLQALHTTLELLQTEPVPGLPPLSGGLGRILRLRPGAQAGAAARTGRRRPRAARHPAAVGHRHRRGRPSRGHHHLDRQRGELERHRRARRLGLRRRRRAA